MGTTSLLTPAPPSPKGEPVRPTPRQNEFFYQTATPQERARAFREWAESHGAVKAVLRDDRREALYEDRG